MNPTLDRVNLAQDQTLLSRLATGYFSILKEASLEQEGRSRVACRFEIPGIGERSISASSSNEAIRLAIIELASILTSQSYIDSEQHVLAIASSMGGNKMTSTITPERFRSKTRQITIGVSMPTRLKDHLASLADSQKTSFAEVSRRFAVFGFEDFVDRSLFVSSKSLFELLENELRGWQNSESEQVMIRLEPGYAVRIRATAKEYRKSVSEVSALSIAHGLVLQEQLASLETKVSSCKGAAIRQLVAQVGLGSYAASLLSGVLVGNIRAPKPLLKRLENILEAPESLLVMLFKRSFESRMVPAFKVEDGKPEVPKSPTPWVVAVKSLNLPADQTQTLLDLEQERK